MHEGWSSDSDFQWLSISKLCPQNQQQKNGPTSWIFRYPWALRLLSTSLSPIVRLLDTSNYSNQSPYVSIADTNACTAPPHCHQLTRQHRRRASSMEIWELTRTQTNLLPASSHSIVRVVGSLLPGLPSEAAAIAAAPVETTDMASSMTFLLKGSQYPPLFFCEPSDEAADG
jgi:hypothetical protein